MPSLSLTDVAENGMRHIGRRIPQVHLCLRLPARAVCCLA